MFAFKYSSNDRLIQALNYKHYNFTVLLHPKEHDVKLGKFSCASGMRIFHSWINYVFH